MKYILIAVLAFTVITGCKKNGTGGKANVHANIKHHTTPIKGATLYVKFDAKELPSDPTNNYDLKETGCNLCTDIHVEGLLPGNYYLYAVGFDSTIMQPVSGGTSVRIPWSDRKNDIETDVPVVE